jgi:hypothetical protein
MKPWNAGMSTTLIAAPRHRRQENAILAVIALLHVLVIALIWEEIPPRAPRARVPALEILQLGAELSGENLHYDPAAAALPRAGRNPAIATAPAPAATPDTAAPPPLPPSPGARAAPTASTAPTTPPGTTAAPGAPAAPIDWFDEQDRVASEAAARSAAPPQRGFGTPEVPRQYAPPKSDFAWSHSHTHRVEPIEGGGIAINLTDQCVLVLIPLPLIGCALGKRSANGDLFRDMHQPAHPGDWKDTSPLQVP